MNPFPLLLSTAMAGPLERVDVLAASPEGWLWDEAPLAAARPSTAAVRLVEQVSLGWALPIDGLSVGTSWRTQELRYARDLGESRVGWVVGMQTRLLMPHGLRGGLRIRLGDAHLEAGTVLDAGSTWMRPVVGPVRVSPALGLGIWVGERDSRGAER
ncbi:MAG: hypothetical protein VX265_09715 [Myxococcota bacterium]|nr:hypothetical protein [Myxococcota bacterium]